MSLYLACPESDPFDSVSQFTLGSYSSLIGRTRAPKKVKKETGNFFID